MKKCKMEEDEDIKRMLLKFAARAGKKKSPQKLLKQFANFASKM